MKLLPLPPNLTKPLALPFPLPALKVADPVESKIAGLSKAMIEEASATIDGNLRTLKRVLSDEVSAVSSPMIRTPWFPMHMRPVRDGRYEIGLGGTGPFPPLVHAHLHMWESNGWPEGLPPGATWWRGLTEDHAS